MRENEEVSKFVNSLFKADVTVYLTDERTRRNMNEFRSAAADAGFSIKQIDFLEEFVAPKPHTHDIDEVIGLEEALEGDDLLDDTDDDNEEE